MPKRILIAEDEASVRDAIRTFIESRSQFEVCEAIDGNEAIRKAESLKPDLVVLDLRMPIANGIEVAARLNVSMPKTPVVIFTMFESLLGKPLTKILGVAAVETYPLAEFWRTTGRGVDCGTWNAEAMRFSQCFRAVMSVRITAMNSRADSRACSASR